MLSTQSLLEILANWSFWDATPVPGLKRLVKLPKQLHADLVLIIQGVRRCGKSTLLTQFPQIYNLAYKSCYYCNFEDPRLINHLDHELLSEIVKVARQQIPASQPCYFFFDEMQNVANWEKWIHAQLERPKNNYFVVTGSNSHLLSGMFGAAVTGRHVTLELYPFSFAEFKHAFPQKNLDDYLITGGFPRVFTYDQPQRLLQEYFNDIIFRDVMRQVHARSAVAIQQVAKMAFESCGSELSYRKISAVIDTSVDTAKLYLQACENAYLLFACNYFAFSEKKQQSRQKKYYPIDPAMRHAVISNISSDLSKALEILTFLHLK